MKSLSMVARVFVVGTILAGTIALLLLLPTISLNQPRVVGTILLLGSMLVVAGLFPIPLYKSKWNVSTAVEFAAVLILSPGLAAWTVGVGTLAHNIIRYNIRLKRPWYLSLFNTANVSFSVAAAGLVYHALYEGNPLPLSSWVNLMAVSLAALTLLTLNSGLVSGLISLVERKPVGWVWVNMCEGVMIEYLILDLIGVLAAVVHYAAWWMVALLAFPMVAVYHSLKTSQELRIQTRDAVEALADTIDNRDRYTHGHSQRVAEYAAALATAMRLPPEEVELIRAAARVHDLGKIWMDRSLLQKPGRLSADEWAEMKKHPKIGEGILTKFPNFRSGRDFVLHHHERYDGRGYPGGLEKSTIPLGARILAVADAYDAMTSDRPYRKALSLEEVVKEFESHSGTQWDPVVVEVMLRILPAKGEKEGELAVSLVGA
ncbi:MAG: HD-GYP domain-containing protein [Anaerolineae bacterium]